jgi:hypothetical protein
MKKLEVRRHVSRTILIFLICAIVFPVAGFASMTGPWWDLGADGSTSQMWDFLTDANPALPDVDENPYGTASAEIVVTGSVHDIDPGWSYNWLGRTGVWHAYKTDVTLIIPNRPDPLPYKEIWVEVEFRGDLVAWDVISTPGGTVGLIDNVVTPTGDGWKKLLIGWTIEPNPIEETIFMSFLDSGADIDKIIVKSICIPEPATMCLLGLGGLLLRKRKHA